VTSAVATPPAPEVGAAPATLPALLLQHAAARPTVAALRVKQLGRWLEIPWEEYASRSAKIGIGLRELGVVPGEAVAVLCGNRPEWLFADLGAQGIGAVTVGIYPTGTGRDVEYVLNNSGAKVIVVEDEEQLDKTLEAAPRVAHLARIVVVDTRGIRSLERPAMSLDELENQGEIALRADPGAWRAAVEALPGGDDVAIVVYTSGVAGDPHGVRLSHANLGAAARVLGEFFGARHDEEVLSYLPLCHVAERLVSVAAALHSGYVVNFGEGGESFVNDLREVQPTFFLGVPRVWEKLMGSVLVRMQNAGWLKRVIYGAFQRRGAELGVRERQGRSAGIARAIAWLAVTRSLRRKLGLARVRIALSGAAPIAPDVVEYFWSLGVPLREVYGQTEDAALATAHPATDVRIGTVGRALPGVSVRIADDGEILVQSPGNFVGYLDDEVGSRNAFDADGWLLTGDLGSLDDEGFLTITGRKKDLVVTAGGLNVSPDKIENLLKVSPFVREAMVIGDRRPFLTALIDPEADAVAAWAARQHIQYTTPQDLVAKPEVRRLIDGEVARVNQQLSDAEQIRGFAIAPEGFAEVGALTATQKVRRAQVVEHFGGVIEGLYPAA
jgi:long-chain acyl-CoA synthetase